MSLDKRTTEYFYEDEKSYKNYENRKNYEKIFDKLIEKEVDHIISEKLSNDSLNLEHFEDFDIFHKLNNELKSRAKAYLINNGILTESEDYILKNFYDYKYYIYEGEYYYPKQQRQLAPYYNNKDYWKIIANSKMSVIKFKNGNYHFLMLDRKSFKKMCKIFVFEKLEKIKVYEVNVKSSLFLSYILKSLKKFDIEDWRCSCGKENVIKNKIEEEKDFVKFTKCDSCGLERVDKKCDICGLSLRKFKHEKKMCGLRVVESVHELTTHF